MNANELQRLDGYRILTYRQILADPSLASLDKERQEELVDSIAYFCEYVARKYRVTPGSVRRAIMEGNPPHAYSLWRLRGYTAKGLPKKLKKCRT